LHLYSFASLKITAVALGIAWIAGVVVFMLAVIAGMPGGGGGVYLQTQR